MMAEGMVTESLVAARTIHDRYHASRRNPWNEVECGDHYARSMASYGLFLDRLRLCVSRAEGSLAFAPRLAPEDFRAAFTAAEGWGTFRQRREGNIQRETVELKWGKLRLRSLAFDVPDGSKVAKVSITAGGRPIVAQHVLKDNQVQIACRGRRDARGRRRSRRHDRDVLICAGRSKRRNVLKAIHLPASAGAAHRVARFRFSRKIGQTRYRLGTMEELADRVS